MEPQKPKKKPLSLKEISDQELEKVERLKASTAGHLRVDNEWLLLTEFALKFGWPAYLDAKNDTRDAKGNLNVEMQEFLTLIEASRKLDNLSMYRNAQASFIGAGSAQTKKPGQTFKQLTSKIIKLIKADV